MGKIGDSSLDVFGFCLGGNTLGWTTDQAQSDAVLDAFTAAGGNFIDTADVYSAWVEGHARRRVRDRDRQLDAGAR